MRPLHITNAETVSHAHSLPASQIGQLTTRFLQLRRIGATIVIAIAICSWCSNSPAQQAIIAHPTGDGLADSIAQFSAEATQRFGIPAAWIHAVIGAESGGNVCATSPRGAMGLMQMMPETWTDLRLRYGLGTDPYDAHDNIIAGTGYLRELYDSYGAPGFLAAYNAGPARWEEHLASGKPLPSETTIYLARLASIAGRDAAADGFLLPSIVHLWTESPLFPMRAIDSTKGKQPLSDLQILNSSNTTSAREGTAFIARSNGLFVARIHGKQSQ